MEEVEEAAAEAADLKEPTVAMLLFDTLCLL